MIRAVITDIEGTTTSIAFVHDVLFPYAAAQLEPFVRARGSDPVVQATLAELSQASPAGDPVAAARDLMARDVKSPPLKRLQGWIWEAGYADGSLLADVYPDVAPQLCAWRDAGLTLAVYSSGSVHAQQLLFGHTRAGDLRALFTGWFDTTTGPKTEPASYARIATVLDVRPAEALFLSDAPRELEAARGAGVQAVGIARGADVPPGWLTSFAELQLARGAADRPAQR